VEYRLDHVDLVSDVFDFEKRFQLIVDCAFCLFRLEGLQEFFVESYDSV
jgi:hypothetical protein